jgi:hypothetical protein
MLGEAAGRGVAAGSGVGKTGRGSGVESGIVSATVSVARLTGEPVMVTTRYGAPPSPDRTSLSELPASVSSSRPQPVEISNAATAVKLIQPARLK